MAQADDFAPPAEIVFDDDGECGSFPTCISDLFDEQHEWLDRDLFESSDDDNQKVDLFTGAGEIDPDQNNDWIVSSFCLSVRNRVDNMPHWTPPTYTERMNGVCNMIEYACKTKLSVDQVIAHIADWSVFRGVKKSVSISVKMRELKNTPRQDFVICYRKMKGLYSIEMGKERKNRRHEDFKNYFEDLMESWALLNMVLPMLVSEGGDHCIAIDDLKAFGTSRVHLLSVIERFLFHHFQYFAGANFFEACRKDYVCASAAESKLLETYRETIQKRGVDEYRSPCNELHQLSIANTNHDLLVQLLSVHKLGRDTAKSAPRTKRKKYLASRLQAGIADGKSNPQERVQPDKAEHHDDNAAANTVLDDATFAETLQSFLDPVRIARLKNQMREKNMMELNRAFELANEAYQSKMGEKVMMIRIVRILV